MHDSKGNPLKVGDAIILRGTITEQTSDQPTYCNITVVSAEGMAPETPGSSFAISARMVDLVQRDNDITHADRQVVLDKTWRRDIDEIIQRIRAATETDYKGFRAPGLDLRRSRERSIVITKLQEAVMWLGMDIKAQNDETPGTAPNPYPSSKDPSTGGAIDPTADNLKL